MATSQRIQRRSVHALALRSERADPQQASVICAIFVGPELAIASSRAALNKTDVQRTDYIMDTGYLNYLA